EIKTADDLLTDGERKMLDLMGRDEPPEDAFREPDSRSDSLPDGPVQTLHYIEDPDRESDTDPLDMMVGRPGGFDGEDGYY
ncbi:MAG: hypothetical protein ACOCV2_15800, partial [Persicimonas sp.]